MWMSRIASLIVIAAISLSGSGCEVGRSFFHMDSNSPTPFFGFDLIPRRSTSMRTRADEQRLIQLASNGASSPLNEAMVR